MQLLLILKAQEMLILRTSALIQVPAILREYSPSFLIRLMVKKLTSMEF